MLRWCGVMVVAVCLALWGCSGASEEERQGEGADMGAQAVEDQGGVEGEVKWPSWTLEDVQPQSARFGDRYGLDELAKGAEGRHVFVALLVGWCPYCRAQAVVLEELRQSEEFGDVQFVVLHGASADNADDRRGMLYLEDGTTPRHGMITFQDVEGVNAWGMHGGKKDDFYIYGPDGTLERYLPGGQQTNLSMSEGRAFVEQALRDALKE